MANVFYPAIIERSDTGFSVFFPDLPGCTSAGKTVNEAALNAEEALAGYLLVSEQFGDIIPHPSELDTILADPTIDEAARLLVRGERSGKSIRINITMDEGLLAAIDRIATNRSGFLADAARVALRPGTPPPLPPDHVRDEPRRIAGDQPVFANSHPRRLPVDHPAPQHRIALAEIA